MKVVEIGEIHSTAIIGDNVKIGKNVTIYPYVVIDGTVVIEDDVTIHSFTNISHAPEHKYSPMRKDGRVFIGKGATLFQHTAITMTVHNKETYIGQRAFLMGGAHIGHDCQVMDDAIVGGNGMMAGHSVLGKGAFLGDSATIHQWTVVGAYSMIGMNCPVRHNVLPFTIVYGSPPIWRNINKIGIERSSIPKKEHEIIDYLMDWYHGVDLEGIKNLLASSTLDIYPTVSGLMQKFGNAIEYHQKLTTSNRGRMIRHV